MDKERIEGLVERMVCLFHDGEVGRACREKTLTNEDERFGALCFATRQFGKAQKLYNELRKELS